MIVHQLDSFSMLKICKVLKGLNSLTNDESIGFYTVSRFVRDINLKYKMRLNLWGTLFGYIGNP